MSTKRQKVVQRTKVGGSLALVVAALLYLARLDVGPRVTLVLGAVLTLGIVFEAARGGILAERRHGLVLAAAGLAPAALYAGALDPASGMSVPDWSGSGRYIWLLWMTPLAVLAVTLLGWLPSLGQRDAARGLPRLLRLALWLCLPLAGLYPLRLFAGWGGLVALILLSKIGDIAGYYVGNAIGQSHPFPKISPGKTTAGCVASLVAGILAGGLCQAAGLFPEARWGLASGLLAGALVNVASQAGDLVESVAKRRAGLKDSGTWFGPSGGLLDLVDSLLLSVPVALLAWPLLFRLELWTAAARTLRGS